MSWCFIDTHCHFDFPPFAGNETESLAQAARAGVERIIVPAVCASRFRDVLALARQYPAVRVALGLHPVWIDQHSEADLTLLEQYLIQRPSGLVAIGEIGLDRYISEPHFDRQMALLEAQLRLAKHYGLPVILHSRRAHDQLAALLRRMTLPRAGVVHGFSGSLQQAQRFVSLGYRIGVGGTITYPRASKTRAVMAVLPLEALLLETDAPDMPLNGWQGQPNRPERIAEVFRTLCELRSESPRQIADTLFENACRLFELSPL
ncbi:metal-dependent hydrolase [Erwinia sp. CPCC 100877]|nr:metal-dependent hydrolase [Erwinia sp. CPCC 100877]